MAKKPVIVRQVWADNLEAEFSLIERAIPFHPLICFDTEFPGTIVHPESPISCIPPHQIYSLMKQNVDALKIIQLGLALSDPAGNLPSFRSEFSYVWQFNFRDFDIEQDVYNSDSTDMLQKQGVDFSNNREKGIDSRDFGRRWISSLVIARFRHSMTWITFHGSYDVGFLIKILTGKPLPDTLELFLRAVKYHFGFKVYDLKYMAYNHGVHGGLEKVASEMGVFRSTGNKHEAVSDSLLTVEAFIKLMAINYRTGTLARYMNGCRGKLYGLCCKTMAVPSESLYTHLFCGGVHMPVPISTRVVVLP